MIWDIIEETGFNRYFSDPNTTITTLLLDENIITELKNQNPQLLEYLEHRKHEFITQLIHYTITLPKEAQGYDRCHRLPYISSELLAIDSDLIYHEFFRQNEKELDNQEWAQLLTFLDGEAAHNEILMGYFQKVVNNLYAGNKMKTTVIVCAHLDRFLKLLPNGSIVDILKQCLILLNVPEGVVLQERKKILGEVIQQFVGSTPEIRMACADILSEIVNKFQAFSSGDVLIEEMLSSSTLFKIYDIEGSEAVNQFLIALLKKTKQRTINEKDQSVPLLVLPSRHAEGLDKYLRRQADNIRELAKSTGFIINQNQQTVRKSNKAMYSLVNLLGLAVEEGINSFVSVGIVQFFWNLVFLYPYNNILHVLVRRIFMGILNSHTHVRSIFLQGYEESILNVAKQHLILLRPFIYCIWAQAKKYPQVTNGPAVLADFQSFVAQELEPLVKYEVKNVQKQSHAHTKLIVDEEDKPASKVAEVSHESEPASVSPSENEETEEDERQQEPRIRNEFEEFTLETNVQRSEQQQKGGKTAQRDNFDVFGNWMGVSASKGKQSEPKKDLFDDFF